LLSIDMSAVDGWMVTRYPF